MVKRVLKVIEDVWSVDREPPCFLYAVKRMLKVIEDVWSINRELSYFLYAVLQCKKHKFLLSKGPPIRSPLLFVCGATHVKNLNFW
jgi:hypothetical protein